MTPLLIIRRSVRDYNCFVSIFLIINYVLRHYVFTALICRGMFPFFLIATNDVTIVRTIQSEALFLQIAIEAPSPSTFNWQPNSRGSTILHHVFDYRPDSFPFSVFYDFLALVTSCHWLGSVATLRRLS